MKVLYGKGKTVEVSLAPSATVLEARKAVGKAIRLSWTRIELRGEAPASDPKGVRARALRAAPSCLQPLYNPASPRRPPNTLVTSTRCPSTAWMQSRRSWSRTWARSSATEECS